MNTFGKRLKALREQKNLTLKEVADALKVSGSTYREWENGRSILGEPYLSLAQILGVSLTELMTGEKPTVEKELTLIEEHIKNIRTFL